MIFFGLYLLISGDAGPHASVANLWQFGGFFPNGIQGFIMSLAIIMFAFGGLELIGITAAETKIHPKLFLKRSIRLCIVF